MSTVTALAHRTMYQQFLVTEAPFIKDYLRGTCVI